jgi:hypothetical protein
MQHLPPRQSHLDRDDAGLAKLNMHERPWWQARRKWPPGVCFDNVSVAELVFERLTDGGGMPPQPIPAGAYGCAADMCAASRFAEPEIQGRSS